MARHCRETIIESKQGQSLRVSKPNSPYIGDWILNSGASDHMTGDASKFDEGSLKQASGHIVLQVAGARSSSAKERSRSRLER
eukprot:scaffold2657_cov368-Pavlova_lutheri.AAC.23